MSLLYGLFHRHHVHHWSYPAFAESSQGPYSEWRCEECGKRQRAAVII